MPMRSPQDSFLGWRREVNQKGLQDKVKTNDEAKLLPAGIQAMRWLHGDTCGSSTEELHNSGLLRKEN